MRKILIDYKLDFWMGKLHLWLPVGICGCPLAGLLPEGTESVPSKTLGYRYLPSVRTLRKK
jgi:hypothetical protein